MVRLLVLLCLSILPAFGTNGGVVTQRVSFFAFSSPAFPVEVFYEKGSGVFEKVELHGANTTPVLTVVNRDGRVRLHGEPEANAEGEMVHPVIGSVKMGAGCDKALVILFADPKSEKLKFNGRSIPINAQDFPDGSMAFANLTGKNIRCRLGTAVYGVKPQSVETLRYKDPKDAVIGVLFQYEENKSNWSRMVSTRWRVPDNGRTIMFAFPHPKTGNPSTKSLPLPVDF